MIVVVTPYDCRVEEVDDLGRLHVIADGLDDSQAGAALQHAHLGRIGEAGHVSLAVVPLRAAARPRASISDWDSRFDAMIDFARLRGWLDPSGVYVAAHIERTAS